MLILRGANDLIQVVTATGTDIEVHRSAMDVSDAAPPVVQIVPNLGPLASITTATTTTIVAAPGATYQRFVTGISLYNNHGSTTETVTVQMTDGTDTVNLCKVQLLAGETLVLGEGGDWTHYDTNMAVYPSVGNAATQTEMEAGTATDKYVSPGRQTYHPCASKCWGEFTGNSTTILRSYNITSVADTATGAMTVTIATDFSDANWACFVGRAEDDLTLAYSVTYDAKAAGSVILRSAVEAGSGSDPSAGSGNASWSFIGFGDL
jgi:hypothetical protein